MFKNKKALLWLIVLSGFLTRLYFSLKTEISLNSYFSLLQAKNILETGLPIYKSKILFPPLFNYIISPLIQNEILLKIFIAAIYSLTAFLVYSISFKISKNENASLLSALTATFIPVFFANTISEISSFSLFIVLFMLLFLSFLNIDSKKYLYMVVFLSFLLPLINSMALLFVPSLMMYLALTKIMGIKIQKKEAELSMLSTFVILWVIFLFFKKALEVHGLNSIYQNIPQKIVQTYFWSTNLSQIASIIGFLPIVLGSLAIYFKIFNPKEKQSFLLISFIFSVSIFLWLKLIKIEFAFIFLGLFLSIIASFSFRDFISYIKKTKAASKVNYFYMGLILLIIFSLVIPSITYANNNLKEKNQYLSDLKKTSLWIKENTNKSSKIIASPSEGNEIEYLSKKRVVMDDNFLVVSNSNIIYNDLMKIYSTPFKTDALFLSGKYKAKYMLVTEKSKKEFSINTLKFADDECFKKVYSTEKTELYEIRCSIR